MFSDIVQFGLFTYKFDKITFCKIPGNNKQYRVFGSFSWEFKIIWSYLN